MGPSPGEKEYDDSFHEVEEKMASSALITGLKLAAAVGFLLSAITSLPNNNNNQRGYVAAAEEPHRRLSEAKTGISNAPPSYMGPLMKDLRDRKKLFEDTPPEEVKYWFEYTGPLQVGQTAAGCFGISRSNWFEEARVHSAGALGVL